MHHLAGHPNVVNLKGVYEDKTNVTLAMEVSGVWTRVCGCGCGCVGVGVYVCASHRFAIMQD